jgi:hypothetical protein
MRQSSPPNGVPPHLPGRLAVPPVAQPRFRSVPQLVVTPCPVVPRAPQAGVVQRKATVSWQAGPVLKDEPRPKWKVGTRRILIKDAEDYSEVQIVAASDAQGNFQLPTIHRRHKIAWSFLVSSVNKALANRDYSALGYICGTLGVANISQHEFNGLYNNQLAPLAKLGDAIFNAPDNVWLGAGNENISLGGGISSAVTKLQDAKRLESTAHHNLSQFEISQQDNLATAERYRNWLQSESSLAEQQQIRDRAELASFESREAVKLKQAREYRDWLDSEWKAAAEQRRSLDPRFKELQSYYVNNLKGYLAQHQELSAAASSLRLHQDYGRHYQHYTSNLKYYLNERDRLTDAVRGAEGATAFSKQSAKDVIFDPHNKQKFQWNWGRHDWDYQAIPTTPRSQGLEKKLDKLLNWI